MSRTKEQRPPARKVVAANTSPCAACPWRTSNHGRPHPDGWYTAKNRERLWAKLRRGDAMTCHPTDPRNPIPAGAKPVPENVTTHECAGGLILQQRELEKCLTFEKPRDYVRACSRGLTTIGLVSLVERSMGGGTPLPTRIEPLEMTQTNLNEAVSHPPLGAWDPEAVKAAKKALGRS